MGKPCSNCKSSNPAKALYCTRCAHKFPDAPKPSGPLPGFPKECPACFAYIPWYANYCYKCGRTQPDNDDIEPYEDPETARLYSWRFFRRMRWVSLTIFIAGLFGGALIWTGGIEPAKGSALLFSLGMGIAALETLIYAFSVHVNMRMKPSSERMYDLYREISPVLRFARPFFREFMERLKHATGAISTVEYEKRVKEAEHERETLKDRIKMLENQIRMKNAPVKIIKPEKGRDADARPRE